MNQNQPVTTSDADVAVVGMGYVGLPLSLQFAGSGLKVVGLDVDVDKVTRLNRGESYIKHISSEAIANMREQHGFRATTEFSDFANVGAIVICAPTPLSKNREPDIPVVSYQAPALYKRKNYTAQGDYPGIRKGNLHGGYVIRYISNRQIA